MNKQPARELGHGYTDREAHQARRLFAVLGLMSVFCAVEFTAAHLARSVVLGADAVHLLMDVVALGANLFAMRLAVRRPSERFTFGLRRAEPIAAMANALLVLFGVERIVSEAVAQLRAPVVPASGTILLVGAAALVVNATSAWLLHGAIGHDHDHDHDHKGGKHERGGHALNLRGAFLHVLGDLLGSVAALTAGAVIRLGGPAAADSIASLIVASILVVLAARLLRDAGTVLLEASPRRLLVRQVRGEIVAFPGISGVHDLHVWSLGAGHDAITAHVRATESDPLVAVRLSRRLRDVFEVEYVTVQVEALDVPCEAPASPGTDDADRGAEA